MATLEHGSNEEFIAINDVPKVLPGRPHISTVWRWCLRGVKGHTLKSTMIGGRRYISKADLDDFIECLSTSTAPEIHSKATSPTATRRKQIEKASRHVDQILGSDG